MVKIAMTAILAGVLGFVGGAYVTAKSMDRHEYFAWRIGYLDGAYDMADNYAPPAKALVCKYVAEYDKDFAKANISRFDSGGHMKQLTQEMRDYCFENTDSVASPGHDDRGDGPITQN